MMFSGFKTLSAGLYVYVLQTALIFSCITVAQGASENAPGLQAGAASPTTAQTGPSAPATDKTAEQTRTTETIPQYDLKIIIPSLSRAIVNIEGTVHAVNDHSAFAILPGQEYKFDIEGQPISVQNEKELKVDSSTIFHFSGTTKIRQNAKCQANGAEFYCLNKVYPNPELLAAQGRYKCLFSTPHKFKALTADSSVIQSNGLQFQIAHFTKHFTLLANKMQVTFMMPGGFIPDMYYCRFMTKTLKNYQEKFGPLPFKLLHVGAIQRGGDNEVNGSPSGNLILVSRTALGAPLNPKTATPPGAKQDISESLRKMVLAHELAHMWFGETYLGADGWMVEGIPQYLGIVEAVRSVEPEEAESLLAFLAKAAEMAPPGAIPNHQLDSPQEFARAYYASALAMYEIGKGIGHDHLVDLLVAVYKKNKSPTFADFDAAFRSQFPKQVELWQKSWRL